MFNLRHELYGESIFTSLRSVDGKIFGFPLHIDRMFVHACLCFGLSIADKKSFIEYFIEASGLREKIQKNLKQAPNQYIRLTLYCHINTSTPNLNKFKFDLNELKLDLQMRELPPISQICSEDGLSLKMAPYPFSKTYRPIKSGSYQHQLNYKKEAMREGFDDVLFQLDQNILELSTANILFKDHSGHYITPKGNHFLSGICLSLIKQFLKNEGHELLTIDVSQADLTQFDSAYALNSVSFLQSIKSIEDVTYSIDQTCSFRNKFLEFLKEQN